MQVALKSDMIDSKGLPVVVGLGTTGLSVARFLARQGRDFVVVDSREDPPGLTQLRQELPTVTAHCGALSAALLAWQRAVLERALSLQLLSWLSVMQEAE